MTPRELRRRLPAEFGIRFERCRIVVTPSGRRLFNFGGYMNRAELLAMVAMGIRRYNRVTGELVGS